MAGDVNLPEVLLPPLPRDGMAMAAPLPVLHEYGPAVRIGLWEGALPHAPIHEADLTEQERLGLQAFRTRLHDSYRDEKENRPRRSASWDEDGSRSGLDEDWPAATPPAPPLPADPTTVLQAPQVRRLLHDAQITRQRVGGLGWNRS